MKSHRQSYFFIIFMVSLIFQGDTYAQQGNEFYYLESNTHMAKIFKMIVIILTSSTLVRVA